jgi:hypothetical protein
MPDELGQGQARSIPSTRAVLDGTCYDAHMLAIWMVYRAAAYLLRGVLEDVVCDVARGQYSLSRTTGTKRSGAALGSSGC